MKPLIYLPLRDTFRVESSASTFITNGDFETSSGVQPTLVNGDFEGGVGPASWSAVTATISRQSGQRTGGSGLYVCRVAYNATSSGYASQVILTAGTSYRFQGWARGDGTSIPAIGDASLQWIGTSSTSWQPFDITYNSNRTDIRLYGTNLSGTHYVEFDDVTVTNVTATGWTAYTAIISKQPGTRTGGSGSYVGQVAYDGSNATGGMGETVLTIGTTYNVYGWCISDGYALPYIYCGGAVWTGTTSTSWQQISFSFTAAATVFRLYATTLSAGKYVQFDDVVVYPQNVYTKNLGSISGDILLGDGYTTALQPTQLTPLVNVRRGMLYAGGNTLNHMSLPAMGTQGSVFLLINFAPSFLAYSQTLPLACQTLVGAGYNTGWMLAAFGTSLRAYWGGASNSGNVTNLLTAGIHSVAMTNDGSNVRTYYDGVLVGTPAAPLGASTRTGCSFGGNYDAAFASMIGNSLYHASVWGNCLTPQQISMLHQKVLNEVSI